MAYQSNYDYYPDPFFLCCGSREVMTLVVFIQANNDCELGLKLNEQRLWSSIRSLDEFALDEFVKDAVSGIDTADSGELESNMYSNLRFAATEAPKGPSSQIHTEPVGLDEANRCWTYDPLKERKLAFVRLWVSFDDTSKASFLKHVSQVNQTSGFSK